ncbi:MAG: lysophospholipid acyltransferase family protein [Candidatus Marinimicrobia bacterium]|nr:lysophospholipid acyltransferase family protein [Candidatus Neomarinimicrobiota bacterium]
MLYYILKKLLFFIVYVFFRRLHVEHQDRVPVKGPVILAANHPNTLMDPVLVALLSGRNPHFLGKSTLFNSPVAKWFFHAVHVIPVYRKQDAEAEMGKNAQIFERCFESLEAGNALVIMPEGISQMDGTLHEIKTGTARIGLGAEARNDFELGIQIIPAGINYSSPTEFFSDVHCRFGRPIGLREFGELYQNDEFEAVYQVTNQIRDALEKLTTTVESSETATVLDNLRIIYQMELATDQGLQEEIQEHGFDFSVTRGMADAINWYYVNEPESFKILEKQMSTYLAKIEGLELRDDLLSTARGQRTFARRALGLLGVIIGFPIYLWGILNNFIPFRIPVNLVKLLGTSTEFLSTIKMLSGFVVFSVFYTLQGLLVWWLTDSGPLTTIYLVSLLPAGRFALFYHDTMQRYRQHLRLYTLFIRRKTLMFNIIRERMALIEALDAAKVRYMSREEERSGSSFKDDPKA